MKPGNRIRGASKEELEELYRERYLGFRRALATVTGGYESAHDVVQEAFARALAKRRDFRGEAPLAAWVWRIALRIAIDESKKPVWPTADVMLDPTLVEPAHDPDLAAALRTLPPRRRLVFFLRYFADLSYEEIAAVCGVSEGTVAATLAQSRAAVAEALDTKANR